MNTKNNQRALQTRKNIQHAFVALLQTNDIAKITVRALCEVAGINRSSFYLHYADVYQLLDTMVEEKARQAMAAFVVDNPTETQLLRENAMENLFHFVEDNVDFYHALLHHNKHAVLFNFHVGDEYIDAVMPYIRYLKIESRAEAEYRSAFFVAGMNAVLRHWVVRDCVESPQEMAVYVVKEYVPGYSGTTEISKG